VRGELGGDEEAIEMGGPFRKKEEDCFEHGEGEVNTTLHRGGQIWGKRVSDGRKRETIGCTTSDEA